MALDTSRLTAKDRQLLKARQKGIVAEKPTQSASLKTAGTAKERQTRKAIAIQNTANRAVQQAQLDRQMAVAQQQEMASAFDSRFAERTLLPTLDAKLQSEQMQQQADEIPQQEQLLAEAEEYLRRNPEMISRETTDANGNFLVETVENPDYYRMVEQKATAEAAIANKPQWRADQLSGMAKYSAKAGGMYRVNALLDDYNTRFDMAVKTGTTDGLLEVQRELLALGMTEDELQELAAYRKMQTNAELAEASRDNTRQWAQDNKIISSAASVPLNLVGGVGYLDVAGQSLLNKLAGNNRPIDWNTGAMRLGSMGSNIREAVSDDMGAVGKFIYNTGMSMADSALVGVLSAVGIPAATALLGGTAATQAAVDAKNRGASDSQALGYGLFAGSAEMLFEKISIGELIDTVRKGAGQSTIKYFLKEALKQGGVEASEEVLTTIANTMADSAIMGDLSTYNLNVEQYGKDEADKMFLDGLLQDALGGFLSGGVMGGLGSVGGAVASSRAEQLARQLTDEKYARLEAAQAAEQEAVKLEQAKAAIESDPLRLIPTTGTVSNSQAEDILKNPAAMQELGVDTSGMSKAQQRAAVRQAVAQRNQQTEIQTESQEAMPVNIQENVTEQTALPQENVTTQAQTPQENVLDEYTEEEIARRPTFSGKSDYGVVRTKAMQRMAESKSAATVATLDRIGRALGVRIIIRDSINVDVNGNAYRDAANGFYDSGRDVIEISAASENPYYQVIAHEVTHRMATTDGKAYQKFLNYALDIATKEHGYMDGSMDSRIANTIEQFRKANAGYSNKNDTQIQEELAARVAEKLFSDEQAISDFIARDYEGANTFYNWIKRTIAKIRRLGSAQVYDYEKAQKLWEKAFKESSQKKVIKENKNTATTSDGKSYRMSDSENSTIKQQVKNNLARLADMEPVAVINSNGRNGLNLGDFRKKVVSELKSTGYHVDRQNFGVIIFTDNEINNSLNYLETKAEAASYIAIPKVLKRGIDISGHENHKNRGYETVTIAAPIILNGERANMAVVVKRTKGNRYKVHRVLTPSGENFVLPDMANAERLPSVVSPRFANASGGTDQTINSASDTMIQQPSDAVKQENNKPVSATDEVSFSMKDSAGRTLSEQQAEYFANSQVRDKDGNLLVVYHGSGALFTEFSPDFINTHGSAEGRGFYFTDKKSMAEGYESDGGQLLEGYLNIANPLSNHELTLSKPEVKRLIQTVDPTGDELLANYDPTGGRGYPSKAWYNNALRETVDIIYNGNDSDSELLAEIANGGAGNDAVFDAVYNTLGYDGYIERDKYAGASVFVSFNSSQFKNADNLTPTSNPDIRYSMKDDFGTSNMRWAVEEGLLSTKQQRAFWSAVANIRKQGYYAHKTFDGQYIIETDNCLVFTDADYNNPSISIVVVFNDNSENNMANAKGWIYDAKQNYARYREAIEDVRAVYGDWYISEYEAPVGSENGRQTGRGERADRGADYQGTANRDYDLKDQIKQYGTMEAGENPARTVTLPKKTEKDKKVSQTVRTAMEAKATPDEMIPTLEQMVEKGDFSYEAISDKQSMDAAYKKLDERGYASALKTWENTKSISKNNTALGWVLYNQAANAGDVDAALDILDTMIKRTRSAAQALQATRILKQLSPEAALYSAERTIQRMQDELTEKYGDRAPKLEIKRSLVERLLNAKTQEEKIEAEKALYQDIGRQMPSTIMDRWNAWRYLAMLGNPRTHVRNIVGNAFFMPVVAVKDVVATSVEAIASRVVKATGHQMERTKSLGIKTRANGNLLKAGWSDYANVVDELMSGGKYSDAFRVNQYIKDGQRIFKNKALETVRRANTNAMEVEDQWFAHPHYAYAFAQYCAVNGITEQQLKSGTADAEKLNNARAYAIREAQKATYRDLNDLSEFMSNVGKTKWKAWNAIVEGVLPFKKTPANILMRAIEYSPIGLAKSLTSDLVKVSKGNITAAEMIDRFASGLTGTGLLGLGVWAAVSGIVRGIGSDDDKEREFEELMGHQSYALEIGGKSYTLDWLAPEALPFFIGVNLYEIAKDSDATTMSDWLGAISNISEPMLQMSCLQSLNDLIESVGYAASQDTSSIVGMAASAATSYLTQGLPTLLGQIERTTEKDRMMTYTTKNGFLTSDMQYFFGKVSQKLPFDYSQIPYIDAWGRTEDNGAWYERGINNFVNPAYASTIEGSEMEAELQRVYEETGVNVFPSRAQKNLSFGRDLTVDGNSLRIEETTRNNKTVYDIYEYVDGQWVKTSQSFETKAKAENYITANTQHNTDDIYLSPEDYITYATAKGSMSYDLLTELTQSSIYSGLADTDKATVIDNIQSYANAVAKMEVSDYYPDGWEDKAYKTCTETGLSVADYVLLRQLCSDVESLKTKDGTAITNSAGVLKMEILYHFDLTKAQREHLALDLGVGSTVYQASKGTITATANKFRSQEGK